MTEELEINSIAYAIDRLERQILEHDLMRTGLASALETLRVIERNRIASENRLQSELNSGFPRATSGAPAPGNLGASNSSCEVSVTVPRGSVA